MSDIAIEIEELETAVRLRELGIVRGRHPEGHGAVLGGSAGHER